MSKIEVKIADEHDLSIWDQVIDASPMGTIFHKIYWQKALEKESSARFCPIVGTKGQEIIFLFPCFLKKFWGLRLLFSPPPGCLVPYMGIVFNFVTPNQHVFEKNYFEAVDSLNSFIQRQFRPDYIKIIHPVGLDDLRPFLWKNYIATPKYTYFISLSRDKKDILRSFTRKVRQQINRAGKYKNIEVYDGTHESYKEIINLVRKRYEEQKLNLHVSDLYMENISNQFGKNHIQIKAIRSADQLLAGMIWLTCKDRIHAWLGSFSSKGRKFQGLIYLLHWQIISESVKKGYLNFDMVGANTRHLCFNKSCYNPELKTYYQVEKTNLKGKALLSLYKIFKESKANLSTKDQRIC